MANQYRVNPPDDAQPSVRSQLEIVIAKIEAENDELHAVSALFRKEARARADILDQAAKAGKPCGPLHGMPILFKELVDIAGKPTAFGSIAYSSGLSLRNAPVIARLEAAGAIILGTTHMVEFAVGSWGTNAIRGTPKNPADRQVHRVPGGSSSGSAVAVAAHFAPIAFGSDTGGSVRIPAALCGVVGFKPSYGLIPLQGVAATGPTFDTLGPIARSVNDARLAVEASAGLSLTHPKLPLNGLRLAAIRTEGLEPIAPEVHAAYQHSLTLLADAGAQIDLVDPPLPLTDIQQINGDIVAFEAYAHLGPLIDDDSLPLDPHVRARVAYGASLSEADYRATLGRMHELRKSFAPTLSNRDGLILPGTPLTAPPLSEVDETQIPMSRYTRLANCLNLCAITLPVPTETGVLPVGFQLSAPAGADAKLLAIAEAVEQLFKASR